MKKRVYIETTIPSYLTARRSRDLIQLARQEITREWWERRREHFELYISQFVLDEIEGGDPDAAARRLELLDGLPLLVTTEEVVELGQAIVREGILPPKCITDAFHVSAATAQQMDILLTWNCRHLANGETMGQLARFIRSKGFESPVICTPGELIGE